MAICVEFAAAICRGFLPWEFAVAYFPWFICRGNLSQLIAVTICPGFLPWELAVAICNENLPWVSFVYASKPFFCVSKSFFFVSKSFLFESQLFLYVNKTFFI